MSGRSNGKKRIQGTSMGRSGPGPLGRGAVLDPAALDRLEESFRRWAQESSAHRLSRSRVFLVFLLIRHTGAKLNEVLRLDPSRDIDWENHCVLFRGSPGTRGAASRGVDVSRRALAEMRALLDSPEFKDGFRGPLALDAAFVRRKFYERAQECGFPKRLGSPEMIRKARAVELLKGHIPLPVVQRVLGSETSSVGANYVTFSQDDIRQVMRLFLERESAGRTSARNAFFGRVKAIQRGDIQAQVHLETLGGCGVVTVITADSLRRLAVEEGKYMVAEVKAPWVVLVSGLEVPELSAENRFQGTIRRLLRGKVTAEVTVELSDGTELCAVITAESARKMALEEGALVWAVFSAYAVVLHGYGSLPTLWSQSTGDVP